MPNWISPNDLKNTAESIEQRLEQNARKRGDEVAERLMTATRNYGGLWFIFRLPAAFIFGAIIATTIQILTGQMLTETQEYLVAVLGIPIFTYYWYKKRPLKVHPIIEFISAPFFMLIWAFFIAILQNTFS